MDISWIIFLSALLNYILAVVLLTAEPGSVEFNQQLGKMTALSFPVISLPLMFVLTADLFYIFRGIKRLTGMPLEEILNVDTEKNNYVVFNRKPRRKDSLSKRTKARPEHLARLAKLKDAGRLLVAGPQPAIDNLEPGAAGYTGSLIIAEFDSLADAQDWAEADPYVSAGVYESVNVKPFKKVLP